MMANGSFEGVFVLLAAAGVGVASIQAALVLGERRAARRTSRIVGPPWAGSRPAEPLASKPP